VTTVERLGALQYRVRGGTGAEPALASLACRSGWTVRRLVRHAASLESVFLALVGVEA
jgi:hypothetical protein